MALAPCDQLGAIEPVIPASISIFDGLGVNNRCAGLAVPAFEDPEVAAQRIVDQFPGAITTPSPKVVVDDPPGGQIMGDEAPRAATTKDTRACTWPEDS